MKRVFIGTVACVWLLAACGAQSDSGKALEPASTTAKPTTTATKPPATTRATTAPTTAATVSPSATPAPPTSRFAEFPAVGKPLTEAQVIAVANAGVTQTFRVAYEVTGPNGPVSTGDVVSANAPPRASVRYGGSARYRISPAQTISCVMPDGAWQCSRDDPANPAGFFADGERDYKGKVREATRTADQTIADRSAFCMLVFVTERDGQLGRYTVCADHRTGAPLRLDSQNGETKLTVKATSFGRPTDADLTPPVSVK